MRNSKQLSRKTYSNVTKHVAYSPFPKHGEFLLRDRSGECFKATLQDGNFVWSEIDPNEFQAANEDHIR